MTFEGDTFVRVRTVVFGRSWSSNGNDNDKGVVSSNGAARIAMHLWSATASMKARIIVLLS